MLINHLRKRRADNRSGDQLLLTLEPAALNGLAEEGGLSLPGATALDVEWRQAALRALAAVDERAHRVVAMRFFACTGPAWTTQTQQVPVHSGKRNRQRARARARARIFQRPQP